VIEGLMAIAQGLRMMQVHPLTPAELGHYALGYVHLIVSVNI
jgi:hypothetical protein